LADWKVALRERLTNKISALEFDHLARTAEAGKELIEANFMKGLTDALELTESGGEVE